jgi:uncharacterized protein YfaS (alpha-2-macroglobulin family)
MKKSLLPLLVLFLFVLHGCDNSTRKIPPFNRSFAAYISSFTSGVISKKSSVNIYFAQDVETQKEQVLTFEPEIEGKLIWVSNRHLQFVPEKALKPAEVYQGTLALADLMEVPDSMRTFVFGFQTLKTDYGWGAVQLEARPARQMRYYRLSGQLYTADEEDPADVEKVLRAKAQGKNLQLSWSNSGVLKRYDFTIDSVERKEDAYTLTLFAEKDVPGAASLSTKEVEIPALGDFKYLRFDVLTGVKREIVLQFSDPLMEDQKLDGLVTLEGVNTLKMEIDNTRIRIFPPEEFYGSRKLNIYAGIKNIEGYTYKKSHALTVDFKSEKPQLMVMAKGNIMPGGDKVMLPFKTISLTAVDVKVVKIPEHNILQFLQNNELDGDRELYRVGEVVATRTIDLTKSGGNVRDWTNYAINLADLVRTEPGALYKVYFSFKKEYAQYADCDDFNPASEGDDDYEYYDYYYDEYDYYDRGDRSAYNRDDYYFTYPQGYTWRERDNPCHVSYYNSERFSTHNILVSDIGVTVKKNDHELLDISLSSLKSTNPIKGASVEVFSYQQQSLGKVSTDEQGFATLKAKGVPYFLVAEKGGQKTYLKLNDGHALSLSAFDVSGVEVQAGLKGFIYGERGVWRPGDSLFLNFILESHGQELPDNHPVVFELSDPRGMLVDRQVRNKAVGRIYDFTSYTAPTALTGNYRATVRVGDARFSERIRIETVKPNRLEIELEHEPVVAVSDGKFNAALTVEWLTGLAAANAKVDLNARIALQNNPFPKLSNYTFSDPAKGFNTVEKELFSGAVDQQGKRKLSMDIGSFSSAPGMLKSRILVKAFEAGGDFSTESFEATLSPYNRYVGVQMPKTSGYFLKTDKDHNIEIRTVDRNGKAVDVKDLEVKVYKVDWHWWYDASDSYLTRYINNEATYLYTKGKVSTLNGKATYKLQVKYPAWGRFLIRVCDGNGHCSGQTTYFDWPDGVGGERPEISGASVLSFTPEKQRYSVGEEVVTKIPVSKEGRVLLTVENGSGILRKEWIETQGKKEIEYRFTADEQMAPNVYISASLLQPHAQTTNDRPIRLYGVAAVEVVNEKTILQPQIKVAEVWRPETKVKVEVSEKNGKAMTYTLAIVDEGLLALTQFKTPDPWKSFYAREALGVQTFDMYNEVLGAYAGTLAQIFAVGGDAALNGKGLNNQNRFKPMVRHLGPFTMEAGGNKVHQLVLPNYIGKVRVMVVAADAKKAYGKAEKRVHVRKPLMVLTSLPRTFSPGEEVSLPVTVFAMEDQVRSVELKVTASNGVQVLERASRSIRFTENGQQVIDFKLKVPDRVGKSTIKVEAVSGNEKAYDQTEMLIRIPNPPITTTQSFFLPAGKDTSIAYAPVGLPSTNSMQLTAYGMPDIHLQERLHYLFAYPHGCAEQTVSRVFPLLYLDEVMSLSDEMKRQREQNLRIAFQKIYELQSGNGGIYYWPGSSHINSYITTYAGDFISEAARLGYDVPNGFLVRWEKHQVGAARNWKASYNSRGDCYNCLDQGYRLYSLAEKGKAEVGAMNRMREERNIGLMSTWNLAGAYAHAGQMKEAKALVEQAKRMDGEGRYYYYGSDLRNMAMKLEVLALVGDEAGAFKLAQEMARDLNGNSYYATHSLAFGLKSMLQFFGGKQSDKVLSWSYASPGLSRKMDRVRSISVVEQKKQVDEAFTIKVQNTGNGPLNFTLTSIGTPLRYTQPASAENISLEVYYTTPAGDAVDISKLRQGQDFVAEVLIRRTGNLEEGYKDIALTQIFPSGWEILNTRLLNDTEQMEEDAQNDGHTLRVPEFQDVKDDRIYTYFGLQHAYREARFKVQLNATYAGRYYLPPVLVEDMYNNEIQAKTASQWVEVIR